MTPEAALRELLERVAVGEGAAAFISDDELSRWPDAAVAEMKTQRLLAKARPATSTVCPGCERECTMPVHVLSDGLRTPAAFVVCDKRDDINRVNVPVGQLEQWHTTGELIADLLARLLGLNRPASTATNDREWTIGTFKGRKHKSLVTLRAGNDLHLSLAGHVVALADVLTFDQNILSADKNELFRCVDKPAGDSETPNARRKRLKARIAEEKAKGRRAFLRTVATEEGISVQRLKQIISVKSPSADAAPNSSLRNTLARRK